MPPLYTNTLSLFDNSDTSVSQSEITEKLSNLSNENENSPFPFLSRRIQELVFGGVQTIEEEQKPTDGRFDSLRKNVPSFEGFYQDTIETIDAIKKIEYGDIVKAFEEELGIRLSTKEELGVSAKRVSEIPEGLYNPRNKEDLQNLTQSFEDLLADIQDYINPSFSDKKPEVYGVMEWGVKCSHDGASCYVKDGLYSKKKSNKENTLDKSRKFLSNISLFSKRNKKEVISSDENLQVYNARKVTFERNNPEESNTRNIVGKPELEAINAESNKQTPAIKQLNVLTSDLTGIKENKKNSEKKVPKTSKKPSFAKRVMKKLNKLFSFLNPAKKYSKLSSENIRQPSNSSLVTNTTKGSSIVISIDGAKSAKSDQSIYSRAGSKARSMIGSEKKISGAREEFANPLNNVKLLEQNNGAIEAVLASRNQEKEPSLVNNGEYNNPPKDSFVLTFASDGQGVEAALAR